jgi:hypothetical protein
VTWVTNRQQLIHDCRQRERERVLKLRHDVFVELADATGKPIQYLMELPDYSKPLSDLSALTIGTIGSANKLHGVAHPGTTIGALLCDMMYQLALADPSLRSMSVYFTLSGLQAIGGMYERLWDETIYSPKERSRLMAEGGAYIKGIY